MRHGIAGIEKRKPMELFGPLWQFNSLGFLQPTHKKVRLRVGRVYVASPQKQLFAPLRCSLSISRNAKSDSHTNGIGKQPLALGKDFHCRLKCTVKQQLGSPGK